MHSWGHLLREEVVEELKWSLDRSSPSAKIKDFSEKCTTVMADIVYLQTLARFPPTRYLVKFSRFWGVGAPPTFVYVLLPLWLTRGNPVVSIFISL